LLHGHLTTTTIMASNTDAMRLSQQMMIAPTQTVKVNQGDGSIEIAQLVQMTPKPGKKQMELAEDIKLSQVVQIVPRTSGRNSFEPFTLRLSQLVQFAPPSDQIEQAEYATHDAAEPSPPPSQASSKAGTPVRRSLDKEVCDRESSKMSMHGLAEHNESVLEQHMASESGSVVAWQREATRKASSASIRSSASKQSAQQTEQPYQAEREKSATPIEDAASTRRSSKISSKQRPQSQASGNTLPFQAASSECSKSVLDQKSEIQEEIESVTDQGSVMGEAVELKMGYNSCPEPGESHITQSAQLTPKSRRKTYPGQGSEISQPSNRPKSNVM